MSVRSVCHVPMMVGFALCLFVCAIDLFAAQQLKQAHNEAIPSQRASSPTLPPAGPSRFPELVLAMAVAEQCLDEARTEERPEARRAMATEARQALARVMTDPRIEDLRAWRLIAATAVIRNDRADAALAFEAITRLAPNWSESQDLVHVLASLQRLGASDARERISRERAETLRLAQAADRGDEAAREELLARQRKGEGVLRMQSYQHLDRKTVEFAPGVTAEFVYIDAPGVAPNGFMMGSPASEAGRDNDERQFRAVLTKGYWLQTTEVTQAQWQAVMGSNPSHFHGRDDRSGGPRHPVERVSWNDCQEFMERLRARGIAARLPTEAEWEFACRAGSTSAYSFGDDSRQLAAHAWFRENAEGQTHPVGTKRPNAWGLFDMHGNVWEWCQDWYGGYPSDRVENPAGPVSGGLRVLRGGSWNGVSLVLRSAIRSRDLPTRRNNIFGVRVAMDSE